MCVCVCAHRCKLQVINPKVFSWHLLRIKNILHNNAFHTLKKKLMMIPSWYLKYNKYSDFPSCSPKYSLKSSLKARIPSRFTHSIVTIVSLSFFKSRAKIPNLFGFKIRLHSNILKSFLFRWVLSVDTYRVRIQNWGLLKCRNTWPQIPLSVTAVISSHALWYLGNSTVYSRTVRQASNITVFLRKGFDLEDPQQETWGPEHPLRTNTLESSPAASIFW